MPAIKPSSFGHLLKYWRRARKCSQLDVALTADVSARHVSFLETGRARPSHEMVLLLSEVLEVPLRERNALLHAAGYAAAYRETDLSSPELAAVRESIEFLLARHDPYPAALLDRRWTLLLQNRAAARVLPRFLADPAALTRPINVMRLLFDPAGLRPFVVNWSELAGAMIQRLHREAMVAAADEEAQALLSYALSADDVPSDWRTPRLEQLSAVFVPLHLRRGDLELCLFSALTTLGTAQDITVQELRLETYFPMDEATDAALRALAEAAP